MSGEIRQFFVTEAPSYKGVVSVVIHVKDRAGKELWNGAISGDAERFGRSYSAENYFEVMSDMIISASYNLLITPGFHDSLQKS